MSLESLVRFVSVRCTEDKTDIWHIADKYRWSYEDAADFIMCCASPSSRMLRDLAREFHTKTEALKERLEGQDGAQSENLFGD